MKNKTRKALGAIGYAFPENKSGVRETLEQLPYTIVQQLRDVYQHEYEFSLSVMDDLLDSVVHSMCRVCDRKLSEYGDTPKDWEYVDAQVGWWLMCDECQYRYIERFNEEPPKGGFND